MASSSTCVLNSFSTAAMNVESSRLHSQAGFSGTHSVPFRLHYGPSLNFPPKSPRSIEFRRLVAKATESTDSPATDLIKNVQDTWEKTDDKLAIGALGAAALIVLWASTGLISAIDKLPILPTFFELVGLLFSAWFVYRYLLFKPDREELLKKIDEIKGKITGSD